MSDQTIESSEGLPIRISLEVPLRPTALAIVVHGFKGFKDWGFFPWLAQHLAEHRIAVCRFNMSRSGIGEEPETFDRLDLFEDDTYSQQLDDLRRVASWLEREVPALPRFLVGHSRGAGIALLGAETIPGLHGVAAWSPIATVDRWDEETRRQWHAAGFIEAVNQRTRQVMRMSTRILDDFDAHRERLDIQAAASRLRVPLLVLHGNRDESVPVAEGEQLAQTAHDASIVLIHRASHTYNAIHPLIDVPFALRVAAEVTAHFINANA